MTENSKLVCFQNNNKNKQIWNSKVVDKAYIFLALKYTNLFYIIKINRLYIVRVNIVYTLKIALVNKIFSKFMLFKRNNILCIENMLHKTDLAFS